MFWTPAFAGVTLQLHRCERGGLISLFPLGWHTPAQVEIREKELIDAKMDKWQEISEIPPRPPLRKRDGGISGVVGIGKMP